MISKEEIILMIENIDIAVVEAKKNYELAVSLLSTPETSVTNIAASIQLRPPKSDGIIVQGCNGERKDLALIYDRAMKEKNHIDAQLVENIKKTGYELNKVVTFTKIFNSPFLSGLYKSILEQKYKVKKKDKEIVWNGRSATNYEIRKACCVGISYLQEEMAKEGYYE